MRKAIKAVASGLLALSLVLVPTTVTNAADAAGTKTVKDETELTAALADSNIKTIFLANDIATTDRVLITRDGVTIDGQGHKIDASSNNGEGWGKQKDDTKFCDGTEGQPGYYCYGLYVVQVYSNKDNQISATLKDVALTGGDAALLVNGSNVTLSGKVDVSGNEVGGIELSKGVDVNVIPAIELGNATLVNTDETASKPVLWVDGSNDLDIKKVSVKYNGVAAALEYNNNKTGKDAKHQVQLFLNADNAKAAVAANANEYAELPVANYKPEATPDPEEPTKPTEPTNPSDKEDNKGEEGKVEAPNTGVESMAGSFLGIMTAAAVIMFTGFVGVRLANRK